MENRTFVSRLLAMKDMKAMLIALAWLLPISVMLGVFVWTSGIKSSSLEIVSLEGAVYFITLFSITATIWLLIPGLLFIICLIADGMCVAHSKVKALRDLNKTAH